MTSWPTSPVTRAAGFFASVLKSPRFRLRPSPNIRTISIGITMKIEFINYSISSGSASTGDIKPKNMAK